MFEKRYYYSRSIADDSPTHQHQVRTHRLLKQLHEFGPRFVKYARLDYGDTVVSRALRKKQIQKVRIEGGDLVLLAINGFREVGLKPSYKLPSVDALRQRALTAQIVRYLHHEEDLRFLRRRRAHMVELLAPTGELVILLCKAENYRAYNLRMLISRTLFRDLFGKPTRVLVYAHPTAHMKRALDWVDANYGFDVQLRDIRPFIW